MKYWSRFSTITMVAIFRDQPYLLIDQEHQLIKFRQMVEINKTEKERVCCVNYLTRNSLKCYFPCERFEPKT